MLFYRCGSWWLSCYLQCKSQQYSGQILDKYIFKSTTVQIFISENMADLNMKTEDKFVLVYVYHTHIFIWFTIEQHHVCSVLANLISLSSLYPALSNWMDIRCKSLLLFGSYVLILNVVCFAGRNGVWFDYCNNKNSQRPNLGWNIYGKARLINECTIFGLLSRMPLRV